MGLETKRAESKKGNGDMENMKIRKCINEDLKKEFDCIHAYIMSCKVEQMSSKAELCQLIDTQLRLASQIVREERAINGEGAYALASYAPQIDYSSLIQR